MKIHVAIYLASRLLALEESTFSAKRLIERVRSEFGDDRPGVSVYAHAHAVANAPKSTYVVYNYLWRIGSARYRCFDRARDIPHPDRKGAAARPKPEDVPEDYLHLLEQEVKGPLVPERIPSLELLNQVFTAATIMTPREELLTAEVGSIGESVLAIARARNYDLIPILENGQIVGLFWTQSREMEPLTSRWLVSGDTSIPHLLGVLAESDLPALLLLYGQDVIGMVTPADMNRLPARVYIYNLIAALEMSLAHRIRRHFAGDPQELLRSLGEERQQKLENERNKLAEGETDVDPVQLLYLSDLVCIVEKVADLRECLGFSSRRTAEKALGGLVDLRNRTMHPTRPLLEGIPEDLLKLHHRVQRAKKLMHRLNCTD